MSTKILLVEDDPVQLAALAMMLEQRLGYKALKTENASAAFSALKSEQHQDVQLIILDLRLPEMGGMEALDIIRQQYPHLPVIMLTGKNDVETAVEAMKHGARDFLGKPPEIGRLRVSIQNALKISLLEKEVFRLKKKEAGTFAFNDLIGCETGLAEVIKTGHKAAATDIPVLLTGETGTGKEVFARALHGESNRSGRPFTAVNCGALPKELVESILFGHEKGAFTGAISKIPGKFREADGGTILLDEIGELPPEAQVKILRVLQQKEVSPVGSDKTIPINVRIISATNRDLEAEVREGRFRSDLFFRLNVLPIKLPSLCDRIQDIPLLAQHFLERFAADENRPLKKISSKVMEIMLNKAWPGNVRELENAIQRAIVLADGDYLEEADLIALNTPVTPANNADMSIYREAPLKTMAEVEQEMIELSLSRHKNNITKAAHALGMAKSTFYRKLKEMGKSI